MRGTHLQGGDIRWRPKSREKVALPGRPSRRHPASEALDGDGSPSACCAACVQAFPVCAAWTHTERGCFLKSFHTGAEHREGSVSGFVRTDGATIAAFGLPAPAHAPPPAPPPAGVPRVVHFYYVPRQADLSIWTFVSVLAVAAIVQPDDIEWLHPRGALPAGAWWECARELVTPRVARDVPLIGGVPSRSTANVGDVIRLELALAEGGLFFDTDTVALRSFDALIRSGNATVVFKGKNYASLCMLVTPPGAPIVRRWLASYADYNTTRGYDELSNYVSRRIADENPSEVTALSERALYLRGWERWEGESMFVADDCIDWGARDVYAAHGVYPERLNSSSGSPSQDLHLAIAPPPPSNDTLADVWRGRGSAHRIARVVLREGARLGLLCPAAAREVALLSARRAEGAQCTKDELTGAPLRRGRGKWKG
jgi:hypothetical protein